MPSPCGLGGPSNLGGPCVGTYASSEAPLAGVFSGVDSSSAVSAVKIGAGVMLAIGFAIFVVYALAKVFGVRKRRSRHASGAHKANRDARRAAAASDADEAAAHAMAVHFRDNFNWPEFWYRRDVHQQQPDDSAQDDTEDDTSESESVEGM